MVLGIGQETVGQRENHGSATRVMDGTYGS